MEGVIPSFLILLAAQSICWSSSHPSIEHIRAKQAKKFPFPNFIFHSLPRSFRTHPATAAAATAATIMNSIVTRIASASGVTLTQQLCRALATEANALTRADLVEKAKEVATTMRQEEPVTVLPGQAFVGDYRSTSALSVGDGIINHTAKWWQKELGGTQTSPLEFIMAAEPIKVKGLVVASYGVDDPALGCPVEYISLKGTTFENPAVCKYTGNKYYSDDWKGGGAH